MTSTAVLGALVSAGLSLDDAESLLAAHAVDRSPNGADVQAVRWLIAQEYTPEEIVAWAQVGRMRDVMLAVNNDVSIEMVRSLPRFAKDRTVARVVNLCCLARTKGLLDEHLHLWVKGGVLRTSGAPWDADQLARWRSVAATQVGSRWAALCCAAGMSPEETVTLVHSGQADEATLSMLAALREWPDGG